MLKKYLAGLLILGLVGSACSSADDSPAGPESSTAAASETTSAPVGTTVVESLTGLEAELDGEPPSTTVSTDPDEQAAADVTHWRLQTFFFCLENLPTCDINNFKKTSTGQPLEGVQEQLQGVRSRNESYLPDALPPEYRVVWARKSSTNPDVVGVLDCQRNYAIRVDNEGNVVEESSPVGLALNRVERSEDGTFKISSVLTIDNNQPENEGGDECSKYDGTEVTDEILNEFLQ